MDGGGLGQFEHFVVSKVSKIIPESIREQWNQWRQSLKNEEKSHLGSNGISETVEMAGWGVERAQERNREEASEFERNIPPPLLVPFPIWLSHYVEMSQTAPRHERGETICFPLWHSRTVTEQGGTITQHNKGRD